MNYQIEARRGVGLTPVESTCESSVALRRKGICKYVLLYISNF